MRAIHFESGAERPSSGCPDEAFRISSAVPKIARWGDFVLC